MRGRLTLCRCFTVFRTRALCCGIALCGIPVFGIGILTIG